MNNDKKATITGLITAIAASVAMVFPQYSELISQVAAGIAVVAGAVFAFYTNKPDAPPSPPPGG